MSRTTSVILQDDYNIGSEGVEQVVTLTSTQTLTAIQPRTLYIITSVATDITITLPTAATAGVYAFFIANKTGVGNAILSTASLISGTTTQIINVDKEGIGIEDTGSTYSIVRDTRIDRFAQKTEANTFTKTNTFDLPVIVANGTSSTHAVNKSQLDLKSNLAGGNEITGEQAYNGVKTLYLQADDYDTVATLLSNISTVTVEGHFTNLSDDEGGYFIARGKWDGAADFSLVVDLTQGLTIGFISSGNDINLYWDGQDLKLQSASTSTQLWDLKLTYRS